MGKCSFIQARQVGGDYFDFLNLGPDLMRRNLATLG